MSVAGNVRFAWSFVFEWSKDVEKPFCDPNVHLWRQSFHILQYSMALFTSVLHIPELRALLFKYQHGCIEAFSVSILFHQTQMPLLRAFQIAKTMRLDAAWAQVFLAHVESLDSKLEQVLCTFASHRLDLFIPSVMDELARRGEAEAVANLHAAFRLTCSFKAIKIAATHGHLSVLRLFHQDNYFGRCEWSLHVMDKAAAFGHFEIVKFLHENRPEGGTTSAMDLAALGGHFEIVKFLHFNRTEGCSKNAMRNAAKEGHLEIVQFLHDHRSEGCTHETLHMAAAAGHAHVVEWLLTNRSEGIISQALEDAARHGHLQVVEILHTAQQAKWSRPCERVVLTAAKHGHLEIVRFFYNTQRDAMAPWQWCGAHVQAMVTPSRKNGRIE
ncbi:hypothetical protein LEN26_002860 [Aphanomyces euteiches]|nr:hypothetical protein LEN26_002860 [Aphanomyces euteiches]